MNEEELIQELKSLNIRQAEIITELHKRAQNNNQKHFQNNDKSTNVALSPGDQVKLLTRGVLSSKGETARVTKVKGNTVHLKVNSNGHNTFRKIKNIEKLG